MKKLSFTAVAAIALMSAVAPAQASDSLGVSSQSALPETTVSTANNSGAGRAIMPTMGHRTPRVNHGGRIGVPRMGHQPVRPPHGIPNMGHQPVRPPHGGHNMGHQPVRPYAGHGRWHGGMRAPGGYSAYRRPHRGFVLPSYWVNPGFSFNNYSAYGLSAPNNGYYWSRYYDDAVMVNNRGHVYDSVPNVNWGGPVAYQPAGFPQGEYGPAMSADRQAYGWGDDAADPRGAASEAGTYQGEWTGQYVDPERRTYRGEWDGTYTNEEGQVYEGTYRGTAVGDAVYPSGEQATIDYSNTGDRRGYSGDDVVYSNTGDRRAYARRPYPGGYQVPYGYERYEQCLKGRGLTGAAIGGILGGFLGNRIAGRGDRLPGTLIGGGIGAIAVAGVEKAANKCRKHLPQQVARPQQYYPPQQGYYPQQQPAYPQYPAGYGWQGGYYYPQQPAVTTVTVTPGTMTTVTETTEEIVYETVGTTHYKGKGLRRPAPSKKRCHC